MLKLIIPCWSVTPLVTVLFCLFSNTIANGQGEEPQWPGFLGLRRDSIALESGILTDWTNEKLKTIWTLPVGEGYAIGSVSGGNYFHFDVLEGEQKNEARLRCVDLKTAQVQWTFTAPSQYKDLYGYDSGPRTSPLIYDGRVYVYGVEGMLWCLDENTGELIWEVNTVEKFGVIQNFFGVSSCPLIHEDKLLVMVGGSPEESMKVPPGQLNLVKPNNCGVVAFDRKTGNEIYRTINDLASYSSMKFAEIHGQRLVIAWMRERLHVFRPENGKELYSFRWRARKLESVNASTPVVSKNRIYIGECYQKGGVVLEIPKPVDPESDEGWKAQVVWTDDGRREKSMAPHWNTPVLIDGFLFGCNGERTANAELNCVEFATGEVKWSVPRLTRSSVTGCDGYIIVMTENGQLLLAKASPDKFELVTKYSGDVKFRSPCWSAPIIVDGKLIVRGAKKVACFAIKDAE